MSTSYVSRKGDGTSNGVEDAEGRVDLLGVQFGKAIRVDALQDIVVSVLDWVGGECIDEEGDQEKGDHDAQEGVMHDLPSLRGDSSQSSIEEGDGDFGQGDASVEQNFSNVANLPTVSC